MNFYQQRGRPTVWCPPNEYMFGMFGVKHTATGEIFCMSPSNMPSLSLAMEAKVPRTLFDMPRMSRTHPEVHCLQLCGEGAENRRGEVPPTSIADPRCVFPTILPRQEICSVLIGFVQRHRRGRRQLFLAGHGVRGAVTEGGKRSGAEIDMKKRRKRDTLCTPLNPARNKIVFCCLCSANTIL